MSDGMIDARSPIRSLCRAIRTPTDRPFLDWKEEWEVSDGCGITVGLIDGPFLNSHSDLEGANLVSKVFTRGRKVGGPIAHGTHSVTSLIGQGRTRIQGISPGIRLLVAVVLSEDGVAMARDVAEALEWLCSSGASVIAITLGDRVESQSVQSQLAIVLNRGNIVLAAAGNIYPHPLMFPARESGVLQWVPRTNSGILLYPAVEFPGSI
jgi:hypothetical protein